MANLWCSTCGVYHEPRSSLDCARYVQRRDSANRPGKATPATLVIGSLLQAALAGFAVGGVTQNPVVAVGITVPLAVVLIVWKRRRRPRG